MLFFCVKRFLGSIQNPVAATYIIHIAYYKYRQILFHRDSILRFEHRVLTGNPAGGDTNRCRGCWLVARWWARIAEWRCRISRALRCFGTVGLGGAAASSHHRYLTAVGRTTDSSSCSRRAASANRRASYHVYDHFTGYHHHRRKSRRPSDFFYVLFLSISTATRSR